MALERPVLKHFDELGSGFNSFFNHVNRPNPNNDISGSFNVQTTVFNALNVLYTNSDCFTLSKRKELKLYLQDRSPDIIGITEIFPENKCFDNQEIFYSLENYDMFIGNLYEGRGVVLYTKSFLNAEQVKFDTVFNESVWCHLKLQNRDSLLVGCVYRSPTASAENFQHLKSLFKKCKDKGYSHNLVMGDFNF